MTNQVDRCRIVPVLSVGVVVAGAALVVVGALGALMGDAGVEDKDPSPSFVAVDLMVEPKVAVVRRVQEKMVDIRRGRVVS